MAAVETLHDLYRTEAKGIGERSCDLPAEQAYFDEYGAKGFCVYLFILQGHTKQRSTVLDAR